MAVSLNGQERILSFTSDIQVFEDGKLNVTETINVNVTNNIIKHGIFRYLPRAYKRAWYGVYHFNISIKQIMCDHNPCPYRVEDDGFYKVVYIGDKYNLIFPGVHTYTISYTIDRQIDIVRDRARLSWNVAGFYWQFAIDKILAKVTLPLNIAQQEVMYQAYTGYLAEHGKNYAARWSSPHSLLFETSNPLQRSLYNQTQDMTIEVTWPAHKTVQPSFFAILKYTFLDYILHIWTLLSGCILISFGLYGWYKFRYLQRPRVIIPRFYPPEKLTPGQLAYVLNITDPGVLLASELVAMAVKGYLRIEYVKGGFFSGSTYILHALHKPNSSTIYYDIYTTLFKNTSTLTINEKNAIFVAQAREILKSYYEKLIEPYRDFNYVYQSVIDIIWVVSIIGCFISSYLFLFDMGFAIVAALGISLLAYIARRFSYSYTLAGRQLRDDIIGFKMFLSTTDIDRMQVIGTPPDKNPQLYEKYLPYAMALGIENKWNSQFASQFKLREKSNMPYVPVWYQGPYYGLYNFNANSFASQIQSFSKPKPTAWQGGSGGSGGSGGTGSGRGGGGGGGW